MGALAFAASILLGVFQFGRRKEREDQRTDNLEQFIKAKKEDDDVKVSPDTDTAIKRLRDNGWTR